MEDLLNIGAFAFDFVEEVIINNLLVERDNAHIRNLEYERLNLNALTPEECKLKFLAVALGIPNRINMENRYAVSGK